MAAANSPFITNTYVMDGLGDFNGFSSTSGPLFGDLFDGCGYNEKRWYSMGENRVPTLNY